MHLSLSLSNHINPFPTLMNIPITYYFVILVTYPHLCYAYIAEETTTAIIPTMVVHHVSPTPNAPTQQSIFDALLNPPPYHQWAHIAPSHTLRPSPPPPFFLMKHRNSPLTLVLFNLCVGGQNNKLEQSYLPWLIISHWFLLCKQLLQSCRGSKQPTRTIVLTSAYIVKHHHVEFLNNSKPNINQHVEGNMPNINYCACHENILIQTHNFLVYVLNL